MLSRPGEADLAEIKTFVDELGASDQLVLERVREARNELAPREPPVAFVHIPKTAGGTVTDMFARAWSRAAVHDAGNFIKDPERSAMKVTRRPGGWEKWSRAGGRLVVGHVPYGLLQDHMPADTRYMTFLREPVDRALSHYHNHIRLTGTTMDQQRLARGLVLTASLEEAFELRMPELMNLATRFLCGRPSPMGELPATALDDAKANVAGFAFVGVQERFEESVVLLQRRFGLGIVPYVNRHVSLDRPAVEAITPEQRALIAEHNRLDSDLYAFAEQLFEEAVAATDPGFAADVEKLRGMSADTDRQAIQDALNLFDRELPPGTSTAKEALFDRAAWVGVPLAAVKHASKLLNVKREPRDGKMIWTRPEEEES
jgi:hypothetical protein